MHLDEGRNSGTGYHLAWTFMFRISCPRPRTWLYESIIKRVIDAGIDAIYLEEPEFWARAGYSESFKTNGRNIMASLDGAA